MLAEREACQIRYCRGCNAKISTVKPFYRWHTIEFCSSFCIDYWLKTHIECRCWACDIIITISNIYVHTEYVDAELCQFCSLECKASYMKVVKLCGYCQKVLTQENEYGASASGFCSRLCEEDFVRILSNDSNCTKKHCTDCDEMKPVKFNLLYNGKSYPFCSFACFFFVKFSCGIYAGKKYKLHLLLSLYSIQHKPIFILWHWISFYFLYFCILKRLLCTLQRLLHPKFGRELHIASWR